jgi:hypothetical protein
MNGFENLLVTGLILAQTAGLLSALAARLSVGSRCQCSTQWLFLGCLALVGAATMVSLNFGPGCWVTSGTTFSLMVLTTTCDFGQSRRAMVR